MKKGFTLAEVLITLGIIGIIAALTIPGLIANYQKKQTVVQLKKTFNELSQAFALSEVDNGESQNWPAYGATLTTAQNVEFLNKYVLPYLKTIKTCDINYKECGFENVQMLDGTTTLNNIRNNSTGFVMANGTSVVFTLVTVQNRRYAIIYIDINGPKGANTVGKDIFRVDYNFYGQGKGLVFANCRQKGYGDDMRNLLLNGDTDNPTYGCGEGGNGLSCGCLIQHDSWEIRDDYPW